MTRRAAPTVKIPDGASHEAADRDLRMVRTDRSLRQALLALLDRKPFEQISIRDIVAEAGVHYATFFRHHPTKEALLDHVAADQIDRLVELALPVAEAQDERAGFAALCDYVDAHRTLWTALLTGGAAEAMRTELLRVSVTVAAQRPAPELWLPVELGVACTVNLIVETISWWLRQAPDACSPAEVAGILHRLMISLQLAPPAQV